MMHCIALATSTAENSCLFSSLRILSILGVITYRVGTGRPNRENNVKKSLTYSVKQKRCADWESNAVNMPC